MVRDRRPRTQPKPAAHGLLNALNRSGLMPLVQTVQLMQVWARVVGAQMAEHCWPLHLFAGELILAVDHPAWKQELHFRQADVLRKVAMALGDGVVESITVRITTRPKIPSQPGTPDADAVAFGADVAKGTPGDEEVKEAVARAASAQRARNRRGKLAAP